MSTWSQLQTWYQGRGATFPQSKLLATLTLAAGIEIDTRYPGSWGPTYYWSKHISYLKTQVTS